MKKLRVTLEIEVEEYPDDRWQEALGYMSAENLSEEEKQKPTLEDYTPDELAYLFEYMDTTGLFEGSDIYVQFKNVKPVEYKWMDEPQHEGPGT